MCLFLSYSIQDFGHSKALLEIQYENEVGTGLGPTLEFYALVSTELQRSDLGLWNDTGDSYKNQQIMADAVKSPSIPASDEQSQLIFVHQTSGVSSIALENIRGTTNAAVMNNNQINMLIEQQQQNETVEVTTTTTTTNSLETSQHSSTVATPKNEITQYVNAPHGMFPVALSKTAKTSQISRLKFKFKFLGKFMAKAVMDSRMVRDSASFSK
jgi:E3 ubiquitin-protein ligase TRIP12